MVAYTDGACKGNPGPGGWAVVVPPLDEAGEPTTLYGHDPATTNNRMEITGALMALELADALGVVGGVLVRTDSQYVVKGMTEWIVGWRRNGWTSSKGLPVVNKDLWLRLDGLARTRPTTFEWVRGHAGHRWNEATDELAVRGCRDAGARGMARLELGTDHVGRGIAADAKG